MRKITKKVKSKNEKKSTRKMIKYEKTLLEKMTKYEKNSTRKNNTKCEKNIQKINTVIVHRIAPAKRRPSYAWP